MSVSISFEEENGRCVSPVNNGREGVTLFVTWEWRIRHGFLFFKEETGRCIFLKSRNKRCRYCCKKRKVSPCDSCEAKVCLSLKDGKSVSTEMRSLEPRMTRELWSHNFSRQATCASLGQTRGHTSIETYQTSWLCPHTHASKYEGVSIAAVGFLLARHDGLGPTPSWTRPPAHQVTHTKMAWATVLIVWLKKTREGLRLSLCKIRRKGFVVI